MNFEDELAQELGAAPAPVAPPAPPPPATLAVVTTETQHPHAAAWAKWRPVFAEAMDGSFHTIEGLEQLFFQNKVQLWPGKNAAVMTEIVTYIGGERALQSLWAAGDMGEVVEIVPGIEAYARLNGCSCMLVEGRAAWTRLLKPAGYAPWSVTIRKQL